MSAPNLIVLISLFAAIFSPTATFRNHSSGKLFFKQTSEIDEPQERHQTSNKHKPCFLTEGTSNENPSNDNEFTSGNRNALRPVAGSGSACPYCPPCDKKQCRLPNCKCSDSSIPGNLTSKDTPQIVIVTLQNAVQNLTYQNYLKLIEDLRNPNGCQVTGTYFVSHHYSDYFEVQSLWSKGHEIGDNSVTSGNSSDYWKRASSKIWLREMADQIEILRTFANVTDVRGMRAPYLQTGGDMQMQALKTMSLLYDSSRVSTKYSTFRRLLWPYTYDFMSIQDCISPPCPRSCFKGVWEVPLLAFRDRLNRTCALLDACDVKTYNDVFRLLYDRFVDHYDSNRAPLVISMAPQWLTTDFKFRGTRLFLEYLSGYKDVYVVSAGRALDWIRNPLPLSGLDRFQPWKCDHAPPFVCDEKQALVCYYDNNRKRTAEGGIYMLKACISKCPPCYPWLNDPHGMKC